jgi:hypothetical protein
MLSALARFGHLGVAPFLSHHLADDELADAAAEALASLFGARVAPSVSSSAPARRRALSALAPDAGILYRGREAWRPSIARSLEPDPRSSLKPDSGTPVLPC